MMDSNNGYLPVFEFDKNWEDPQDFPTLETNEEQVRKDMQDLHEQTRKYINERLIPAIRNGAFGAWELYDPEKQYNTGDRVFYEGRIYVCKIPCCGILPTDEDYWVVVQTGGSGTGDTSWIYDEIDKVYSELKQTADEISAEVVDLDDSLRAEIKLTAEQLTSRIESGEEATYSEIQQNAELIRSEVANMESQIQSSIEQSAQQIYTEVVDSVRGDLSRIEQEADEIKSTVADAQGDISSLKQTSDEISAGLADAEGDIAQLKLTTDGLVSRVESNEGEISRVEQKADEISAEVKELDSGLRSEITQTADTIRSEVEDVESGLRSEIEQTATSIRSEVSEGDDAVRSEFQQTASSLETRIETNDGDISTLKQTADGLETRVTNTEGDVSSVTQKVDSITMSVAQSTGADGKVYASITLRVGDQMYTGQILMEGNLNVDGQLSADALYAALGDIADLTVDKFSTSRRIAKYLAGDTSDDNYIQAQDEQLCFMSGEYDGGEEQAVSPNGLPVYWESDPEGDGVSLGTDGYPYLEGVRIFTTTAETDWPVMVYTYDELVKAKFAFEDYDGIYTPVLTMGAGNEQGRNKGYIVKSADGMEIVYKANTGDEIGMRLGNDGYTDIYGLRKTTGMNFSEWDSGRFYERVSGDATRYQYLVHFDAEGKPVLITDPDGNECTITW